MARARRPEITLPVRRTDDAPPVTSRDLMFRTWAGRLFLIAVALKLLLALWRTLAPLPAIAAVFSGAATLAMIVSLVWFGWRLFVLVKRRLLWRVRRKLILSYIFIGVVPALLILVFFLFAGNLVFMNVSAYLFKDGYDQIMDDARLSAQAAATEITRSPGAAQETVQRVYRIRQRDYPALSIAYVPRDAPPIAMGPWKRMPAPANIPSWLNNQEVFVGTFGVRSHESTAEEDLLVRAIVKVAGGIGAVVVEIPVDDQVIARLRQQTGVNLEDVFDSRAIRNDSAPMNGGNGRGSVFFEKSLTQLDIYRWDAAGLHRDTLALGYRLRELYGQLSSAQSMLVGGMRLADALMFFLVAIGIMFLIIEAVALVMGLALARSITSSVHELFMGTERVRQGDFTHRIAVRSRDQLGELADSFNQMTGSIENLLQTAAEKKRLDEELRIARQIQMSLLPRGALNFPGLGVTALCVPAREVGGDYYDFFPLGQERIGVLIADVSGKGTSAALYMAELKGLMLSLSKIYQSPHQLLLEVNRIISDNLDTRSFITMTYAVIDLRARVLTFARAGHTPLLYLPGDCEGGDVQVLTPSGLVVGLRIPGAQEKFEELLEEARVDLHPGDVFVLYTDGISEAMNPQQDLFGDARLGSLVAEHGHLETGELRERILREVESFVDGADQHDDMTMILIKVEEAAAAVERVAV
ncbi:MAG TPA: SpoIIE family protein phosphatase [Vicinamibacterales bacterium]|nr:SpoIIE family protein phosphatase [Vicinamibacterales bacterium]